MQNRTSAATRARADAGNGAADSATQSIESRQKQPACATSRFQTGHSKTARRAWIRYVGPDGKPLRDAETLIRIRSLVVPPAWNDVWICPSENGHIQVTARDARAASNIAITRAGARCAMKRSTNSMIAFGRRCRTSGACRRDLGAPGLPREKVLAAVVRLLETTLIRVGNEEYARAQQFVRPDHACATSTCSINGEQVAVRVSAARAARSTRIELDDRRLANIVRRCQDLPGQELFQYLDERGRAASDRTSSETSTTILRDIDRRGFHRQGFPHLGGHGARRAGAAQEFEKFDSAAQAKQNIVARSKRSPRGSATPPPSAASATSTPR